MSGNRRKRPIIRLHPSIKGVRDAQSSGASIISVNLDAFTSYGESQGSNAPVSERVAFAYTTALNELLRKDSPNRIQLADATTVFWAEAEDAAKAEAAETLFAVLSAPPSDADETNKMRDVLLRIEKGRPLEDPELHLSEGTRFIILGLAPNAARISVRFWHEMMLGELGQRFYEHWRDLKNRAEAGGDAPRIVVLASRNRRARQDREYPISSRGRGHASDSDWPPAGPDGEEGSIALSALQHYLFCPRQCALIHVEQTWAENLFTAEGRLLHERTDEQGSEKRRGVRVVTAMPLASRRLHVSGVADLVELHEAPGGWRPVPAEYKRGKPKAHRADEVQLCAQAICLEEMFATSITEGALFYGQTRRRVSVVFDDELRALTQRIADEARALIGVGNTPPPHYDKRKCSACSLAELCKPKRFEWRGSVAAWLHHCIEDN